MLRMLRVHEINFNITKSHRELGANILRHAQKSRAYTYLRFGARGTTIICSMSLNLAYYHISNFKLYIFTF